MQPGFVYEGRSEVLRNPADMHSLLVFDPAIRHHTDQVVLKFRKPGAPEQVGAHTPSSRCRMCA
jgi:predicted methyltransferase